MSPSSPHARATALRETFRRQFGRPPEGVWMAPGRANLIGEHTDYNEGLALPFAIDRSVLAAVRRLPVPSLELASVQLGRAELPLSEVRPGHPKGWAAYVAGAAWAVATATGHATGAQILVDGDVPLGAGLSSSAALECAVVVALCDLLETGHDEKQRAELAQRAEVEIARVPCGLMDQLASTCGRADHALLVDFRSLEVTPHSLALERAGLRLLVVDTRAPHQLVTGEYSERRATCREASRALGVPSLRDASPAALAAAGSRLSSDQLARARHVVTENARVAAAASVLRRSLEAPDALRDLGPLLSQSHASLRDDFEVSVPELDLAAAACERAGALGARMIGGGFGGSVLALLERGALPAVREAVARAFARQGFGAPASFPVAAVDGARRVL